MGWPRRLILVRHAESEGNVMSVEERTKWERSSHEYRLTKRGRNQANLTGEYLKKQFRCGFDAYYSSYYIRSRETLSIMFPEAKVIEDSRLAEAQRGIWHAMSEEEIAKVFPHEIEFKKREGLYHHRPLGGENWPDIEMRIHSFRNTLACEHESEQVLVIVHGNWHSLFRRVNDGLSVEEVMKRYSLDNRGVVENASVTIYEGRSVDGKPRLVLKEENIVPWEDGLCDNCYGRGEVLERDEDGERVEKCFKCKETGLK
ncbi:MAG: histidine phosphatase family protein [Patescibacteria group bacterium]